MKILGSLLALGLVACTANAELPAPSSTSKASKAKPTQSSDAPADEQAAESATVTDLGEVTPDTELGFDVAEGTLGFNIVVTGHEETWVGITSLVSPSGVVSVADFHPDNSPIHVAIGSRGMGAFNVPQTDATTHGKVETGRWKMIVAGITPDPNAPIDKTSNALPIGTKVTSKLHVTISTQKTSDGEFHGGELDLHVYIPDGLALENPGARHTITADVAPDDEAMQARMDEFYQRLSRLFGIGRGEVSFHPIDSSFLSATTGPARASLIAQATVASPQALHVVYTNRLAYGEGDGLLGYSVGLPGAVNTAGTVRSAITVASYKGASAATDASTMLHEMGHFLGLLHSTEFDGQPDLFADTPTCGERCGKNDPVPDLNNLMFPCDEGANVIVSPSQVRVVQGSPIYRAFARAKK